MKGEGVGGGLSPLEALWAELGRVGRFSLVVRPRDGEEQAGEGAVRIGRPAPDQLDWEEAGRWRTGPLAGNRFRGATRWERRPEGVLAVAHLRQGPDLPVPLVTFRFADGAPIATGPHECGPDRYEAAMAVTADRLLLEWRVAGPAKQYRLLLEYHAE